jgi:hypothetical protein
MGLLFVVSDRPAGEVIVSGSDADLDAPTSTSDGDVGSSHSRRFRNGPRARRPRCHYRPGQTAAFHLFLSLARRLELSACVHQRVLGEVAAVFPNTPARSIESEPI